MWSLCWYYIIKILWTTGGVNKVVEIDVLYFSKHKTMLARFISNSWFLKKSAEDNECFLYTVPNSTADMPLTVIRECILPGITILFDLWKSYTVMQKIPSMNYQHGQSLWIILIVNNSENFVGPENNEWSQCRQQQSAVTGKSVVLSEPCLILTFVVRVEEPYAVFIICLAGFLFIHS